MADGDMAQDGARAAMARERKLLDGILLAVWAGHFSQEVGRSFLQMRKETFIELMEIRVVEMRIEQLANECLERSFNAAFPWCDPEVVMQERHATRHPDSTLDAHPETSYPGMTATNWWNHSRTHRAPVVTHEARDADDYCASHPCVAHKPHCNCAVCSHSGTKKPYFQVK